MGPWCDRAIGLSGSLGICAPLRTWGPPGANTGTRRDGDDLAGREGHLSASHAGAGDVLDRVVLVRGAKADELTLVCAMTESF